MQGQFGGGSGLSALPIVFCNHCGCFSISGSTGLKHICKGADPKHRRHLKALRERLHPVHRTPIWGVSKLVSGRGADPPCAPHALAVDDSGHPVGVAGEGWTPPPGLGVFPGLVGFLDPSAEDGEAAWDMGLMPDLG